MSLHNDSIPYNLSFTHQHSYNHNYQPKYNKKTSITHKSHNKTPANIRLKTDQKDNSIVFRNQNNRNHPKNKNNNLLCKNKIKNKHTLSVINLKNTEEWKVKGSSTTTKRKQSNFELTDKIKQKIEDFKILSNCLEQYIVEQRKNNQPVNIDQIIKMISAFNRSQISTISKPLEKLISDIVISIQRSLPQNDQNQPLKSILKKSVYESPDKGNRQVINETKIKQAKEGKSANKSTVKKASFDRKVKQGKELQKKQQISSDVKKLQQNLSRLKYESSRLKYFFEQINLKSKQSKQRNEIQKKQQLQRLRAIANNQAQQLRQLEGNNSEHTYRESNSQF